MASTRKGPGSGGHNKRLLTHGGETRCIKDWAKKFGLHQSSVCQRIRRLGVKRALAMGAKHR